MMFHQHLVVLQNGFSQLWILQALKKIEGAKFEVLYIKGQGG